MSALCLTGALVSQVVDPDRSSTGTPGSACTNFGQVAEGLYRGAEPDRACLGHLARLGVRMIVNLRDEPDASDREAAEAAALGLRYVNIPMSGFSRPSADDVERALGVLGARENRPVFVHCKRGRDRTGVIVAAYRMACEGWTAESAREEAERFGLAWWQVRMKEFIRTFPGGPRCAGSV